MNKKIFLSLCALLVLYICYKASSIVATFFAALAFAYLLQPIAYKIHHRTKLSYTTSAIIVFLVFIALLFTSLAVIIPKIIDQVELLAKKIPDFQRSIKDSLIPALTMKLDQLGPTISAQIKHAVGNIANSFGDIVGNMVNFLWGYLLSTINLITMCLLMPVLLVFFLKDWPEITKNFKLFITKLGFHEVNSIWKEADDLIVGFIRSLLNVSLILIIYYTIALNFIGFEFAMIFGLLSGLAILVPFIGALMAFLSCIGMSLLIHGFNSQQLFIMLTFAVGQGLDSSILTPKIVGDKIGLHPAAIIFSVLVCGHIMGIAGLFLAIPIAGMVKIIFKRFVLTK